MPPDSDGWQRLHPLSPILRAGRLLVVLVIAASQSLGTLLGGGLISLIAAFFALVCTALYGYVAWVFMRFRLQDEHIELREGIVSRTHKRAPLTRLESVDIVRPVIARVFGIAEVRVELAGSEGSDIRLKYLAESDAVALREQLLVKKSQTPDTEVFQLQEPEVVIAAVSTSDLLLGYGAARAILPLWLVFVGAVIAIFDWRAAGVTLVTFFIAMIGWLVSVAATIEKSWGFRLSESDGGFTLRRGLLNLLTQKVPLHRVQAVRVVTPLIWRPFGRSKIVVDIAGYGSGKRQEQKTTAVLLPIGSTDKVRAVLDKVFPELELSAVRFQHAPGSAKWRSPFFWRTYGVAWTPTFAITRSGVFNRLVDVVPHRKVQSLRITEGPWQKRLGLATLHLDTAGGNVAASAKHRQITQVGELAMASRAADQRH